MASTQTQMAGTRPSYPQNWPMYNAAQVGEKSKFLTLLRELCDGIPSLPPRTGRPSIPLPDAVFAVIYKVYSTVSARRFMTDLHEAHRQGLIGHVPHYNSIFNILGNDEITPILIGLVESSAAPLRSVEDKFAIDSTGFGTSRYSRWFDHEHEKEGRQQEWIKCHLASGVLSHVVPAVVIKGPNASDTKQFPSLLETIGKNFKIAEILADKAYSSKKNIELVVAAGGTPFIPFRDDAVGRGGGRWTEMFHHFQLCREEFEERYHQRSNVESAISAIKRKYGGSVRSRTETGMKNEIFCKVICHNIVVAIQAMYTLGIDPEFWPSESRAPSRMNRSHSLSQRTLEVLGSVSPFSRC